VRDGARGSWGAGTGGGSVGEEEAHAPGGDRHGTGGFSFRPDAARVLAWFVRRREEGEKGNGCTSSCWRRPGAVAACAGRGGGGARRQGPGEEGRERGGGTWEEEEPKGGGAWNDGQQEVARVARNNGELRSRGTEERQRRKRKRIS
jgi:hypothetical protein